MYFSITGAKIIVRYTEDYANRGSISRFHCKIIALHFNSLSADNSQTFSNFIERDNKVKSSFKAFFRRFSEVCTVHVYRVGNAKRTTAWDFVKTKCQQVKDSCFEKKPCVATFDVSVNPQQPSQQPG